MGTGHTARKEGEKNRKAAEAQYRQSLIDNAPRTSSAQSIYSAEDGQVNPSVDVAVAEKKKKRLFKGSKSPSLLESLQSLLGG